MSSQEFDKSLEQPTDPVQKMLRAYRESFEKDGPLPALSSLYEGLRANSRITPERRLSVMNPLIRDAINTVGRVSLEALEIGKFAERFFINEGVMDEKPASKIAPKRPRLS